MKLGARSLPNQALHHPEPATGVHEILHQPVNKAILFRKQNHPKIMLRINFGVCLFDPHLRKKGSFHDPLHEGFLPSKGQD